MIAFLFQLFHFGRRLIFMYNNLYPISSKLLNILIIRWVGAFGQLGGPVKLNPNKRMGDYLHIAIRGILLIEKDARIWLPSRC